MLFQHEPHDGLKASEIIRQSKPFLHQTVSVTLLSPRQQRAMAPILMFYLTLIPSLDSLLISQSLFWSDHLYHPKIQTLKPSH